MKNIMEKLKTACKILFEGDLQMSKKDLWLAILSGTLLGVVIGLFCAPMTHGVYMEIGSNNGNNNGSNNGNDDCCSDCDCQDECECIGVVE